MTLKNDGRVSNKDKKKVHKKYRDVKCNNKDCKKWLDIQEMYDNNDYDILPDGSYAFYCSYCNNTVILKL